MSPDSTHDANGTVRYLGLAWIRELTREVAESASLSELATEHRVGVTQVVTDGPEGDVTYHLQVGDGAASFGAGPADPEHVRMQQDWATAVAVATGELNAQEAFITGRIRLFGDQQALMRTQPVFAALDTSSPPSASAPATNELIPCQSCPRSRPTPNDSPPSSPAGCCRGSDPLKFTALKTAVPAPDEGVRPARCSVSVGEASTSCSSSSRCMFAVHLMQGGRLLVDAKQSAKPRGGQARFVFDGDGPALLLTEAGTERRAGVWCLPRGAVLDVRRRSTCSDPKPTRSRPSRWSRCSRRRTNDSTVSSATSVRSPASGGGWPTRCATEPGSARSR